MLLPPLEHLWLLRSGALLGRAGDRNRRFQAFRFLGGAKLTSSSVETCAISTALPLKRAATRCPNATAQTQSMTDARTLIPARTLCPFLRSSNVCKLKAEKVVNP